MRFSKVFQATFLALSKEPGSCSYATHVLKLNGPRISEFEDAILDEDEGLQKRKLCNREKIPQHKRNELNILRSRYVNAIKDVGTSEQK